MHDVKHKHYFESLVIDRHKLLATKFEFYLRSSGHF